MEAGALRAGDLVSLSTRFVRPPREHLADVAFVIERHSGSRGGIVYICSVNPVRGERVRLAVDVSHLRKCDRSAPDADAAQATAEDEAQEAQRAAEAAQQDRDDMMRELRTLADDLIGKIRSQQAHSRQVYEAYKATLKSTGKRARDNDVIAAMTGRYTELLVQSWESRLQSTPELSVDDYLKYDLIPRHIAERIGMPEVSSDSPMHEYSSTLAYLQRENIHGDLLHAPPPYIYLDVSDRCLDILGQIVCSSDSNMLCGVPLKSGTFKLTVSQVWAPTPFAHTLPQLATPCHILHILRPTSPVLRS